VSLTGLSARDMREDLAFLAGEWARRDSSFGPTERRGFRALVERAMEEVEHLDPLGFWMRVSHAVALARNGHTNVNAGAPPFSGLPLRFWWFKDGLFVVEAAPSCSGLLGARVEKIGRATALQALSAVSAYISGNGPRIRCVSPRYLRIPGLLHRLGITESDREVPLTLRGPDGRRRSVRVPLDRSRDPRRNQSEEWAVLIPAAPGQRDRWVHVLDRVPRRPLAFEPATDLDSRWLSTGRKILYIRSNWLSGASGDDLSLAWKFVGLIPSEVVPKRPRAVIVDLRFNSGGNFGNTILFAQALPKLMRRGEHVFVLVSPSTFSAAIVTVALLKDAGGPKVRILGTNVGDNERFWAEGPPIALPRSGLRIQPAPELQDWAKGGSDPDRYFWANVVWGPKRRISLRPEIIVEPTFAEYASGRDPVLERALALTR